MDIQCNANIEEIIIDPKYKQADGVRVNGLVKRFDKVLCTADFPYAAQQLMPQHAPVKNILLKNRPIRLFMFSFYDVYRH